MRGHADIYGIVEQFVENALVDQLAILVAGVFRDQLPCQRRGRADLEEALKDRADKLGIDLVDDQLAVYDLVLQRRPTAHPHAPLARGGKLVPDALTSGLPFVLSE